GVAGPFGGGRRIRDVIHSSRVHRERGFHHLYERDFLRAVHFLSQLDFLRAARLLQLEFFLGGHQSILANVAGDNSEDSKNEFAHPHDLSSSVGLWRSSDTSTCDQRHMYRAALLVVCFAASASGGIGVSSGACPS